jgi:ABC-2 type transport system ATP-binding protein
MNSGVSWQQLSHRYPNGVQALRDLNLEMRGGETLALLGPNGAGKSTAIKLLLGLLPTQTGSVTIFGRAPTDPASREQLGAVLQVAGLPAKLTVLEQMTLHASYFKNPRSPREVLTALGLEDLAGRRLNALSGGQRRRLEMALALVGRPQLLVLDEPTVGVDIHERARLMALLAELKNTNVTILLTTHVIEEAERLADRVAYLDAGELRFVGSINELKARSGLQEIGFETGLSLERLALLDPSANIQAATPGYRAHVGNANAFIRALLNADASATIHELKRASLETALRTLN